MRHLLIDEVTRSQRYAARDLVNRRDHWWFGLPMGPRCWLLGHKPVVIETSYGGGMYVRCDRCDDRPTLPPYWAKSRDGWRPEQHHIDEIDRRSGWSHSTAELSLQTIVPRRPRPVLGAQLHVGGRGSETPFDAHVKIGGLAAYLGVGFGHGLADRISGKAHNRTLRMELSRADEGIGDGLRIWWNLWTGEKITGDQYPAAKWRSGFKRLSIADKLWGPRRYTTEVVDQATIALDLDDGLTHLVEFKLERRTIGRTRQAEATKEHSWGVDWNIVGGSDGVGTKLQDGKWVRSRTYGSSAEITDAQRWAPDRGWIEHAGHAVRAWTREQRARHVAERP